MITQETSAEQITANAKAVISRIAAACARAGRDPAQVELLAVTKYAGPAQIRALLETGLARHAGESRMQGAAEKWNSPELAGLRAGVTLHFLGHLQSNKAAKAASFFDAIDSVDSMETARVLSRKAAQAGRKLPVLIQVKLTEKETQSGVSAAEASALVRETAKLEGLAPRGYMAIAPVTSDPEELRPYFRAVKRLFDADFARPAAPDSKNYLSLGMTHDFEIAVEEGSNLPRVGSAIFGN
ncbi:MAG: YggS family pyridoxal phosphate-dependent enzyme [Elusimicrobiales bacterium]|nr:YggS family pyridoxal phosphate-dependent enzyme [Elusimicrobiales bacterium]